MNHPSFPLFEALGPLALHSFFLLAPAVLFWVASCLAESVSGSRSRVESAGVAVVVFTLLALGLTLLYAGLKVWWTSLLFFISLT